jgi:hypothetical protein
MQMKIIYTYSCPCRYISKIDFSLWKPPGVSERMWSISLEALISGEYQTLQGHSNRLSEKLE